MSLIQQLSLETTAELLADGDLRTGMKGAPVLNLRTRGVCAMVCEAIDKNRALALPFNQIAPDLTEVIALNRAFHENDTTWVDAGGQHTIDTDVPPTDQREQEYRLGRQAFASRLLGLRRTFGMSVNTIGERAGILLSQAHDYFSGRRLPDAPMLRRIMLACNATPKYMADMQTYLADLQEREGLDQPALEQKDQPDLLARIYVPSGRMYAAQAHRFLSLFCDWTAAMHTGIRFHEQRTPAGDLYEFFGDGPSGEPALREHLDEFAHFLNLCDTDPGAAADTLAATAFGPAASGEMVAWFGTEVRVLREELHGQREVGIVRICTGLQTQLLRQGHQVPRNEVDKFVRRYLVPEPDASTALALPALPTLPPSTAPNVNYIQIIQSPSGPVFQNYFGETRFGPGDDEILKLIEQAGGPDRPTLINTLHLLENDQALTAARVEAKHRLLRFLRQAAKTLGTAAISVAEQYIASRIPG